MKLNKIIKLSLGAAIALPTSIFFGNEVFVDHSSQGYEINLYEENLLACGGGGGGGGGGGASPAAKKAKAAKQAQSKINAYERIKAKKAAKGEDTTAIQAKIDLYQQLIDEQADAVY